MALGRLVEFLKKHYEFVSVHRNELGQPVIYITKDGVTIGLTVERVFASEPKL